MIDRFIQATFLGAVVLGAVACVEEDGPDLGTSEAAVIWTDETYGSLKGAGAYCRFNNSTETTMLCTLCSFQPERCAATGIQCDRYICTSSDPGAACYFSETHWCWEGGLDDSYQYSVQRGFEAESVNRYAPMVIGGLNSASNGGYVTVPRTATGASNLRYSFELESDVELYSWARVQVPTPVVAGDMWITLDGQSSISVHPPYIGANVWQWVPLADASTGEHVPFVAPAGPHQFRLFSNPTGVRIDRVILTNDPFYVPVTDVHEAESMNVYGPMVKVVPPAATLSNPGYIWVPNGAAAGGEASKVVYVVQPGLFSIWGRVNARNTADNSFDVSSEYEQTTIWSPPVTGTNVWRWHQVLEFASTDPYLFDLETSFSSIEVLRREDGTKLDRFLVTNDPGFLPVDVALVVGSP